MLMIFFACNCGPLKKVLAFTSDIHVGKLRKLCGEWRIAGDASCTDVAKEKSTQETDMIHPVDGKNCLQRFGESLDISTSRLISCVKGTRTRF